MALPFFEGSQRVAPIYHEFLLLPKKKRAGSSHERNLIGARVSFPKRSQRVAPDRSHIEVSVSTLEDQAWLSSQFE